MHCAAQHSSIHRAPRAVISAKQGGGVLSGNLRHISGPLTGLSRATGDMTMTIRYWKETSFRGLLLEIEPTARCQDRKQVLDVTIEGPVGEHFTSAHDFGESTLGGLLCHDSGILGTRLPRLPHLWGNMAYESFFGLTKETRARECLC
jgi:hypothetical protein